MDQHLPRTIRRLRDEITHECRQAPTVELVGPGRWRLGVANERVQMTVDLAAHGVDGRIGWVGSRLWVDGEERHYLPRRQFYDLFNGREPEAPPTGPATTLPPGDPGREPEAPPTGPATTLPPGDPGRAPKLVRITYQALLGRFGGVGKVDISLGNLGKRWMVQVVAATAVLQAKFIVRSGGRCGLQHYRPIELWIDGKDHTDQVGANLPRALESMAQAQAPSAGPKINGPAPAAVNDGVRVRKQSVMRI